MNKFLHKSATIVAAIALVLYELCAVFYWPIYFIGWLLHKIAKLLLGISYLLLLKRHKGWHIIKGLFRYGPAF